MKIDLMGEQSVQTQDLLELETRLQEVYLTVTPRAEFKRELKNRLMIAPEASLAEPKPGLLQYILLTAAGLVSGTLILIFGVKAVQHLKTHQLSKAPAAPTAI